MESGEAETGSDPNQPHARRAVPPPLPAPLSYRTPSPTAGWTVVGSYRSANQRHSANKALSRHGIVAQMRTAAGDEAGFDLLVVQTEAEWARDLLSRARMAGEQLEPPTHGFPVYDPAPIQTNEKTSGRTSESMSTMPAMPVNHVLSERQQTTYTIWIILLWILMGVVVLVIGLFAIYASN
jgi:hypothetical protein